MYVLCISLEDHGTPCQIVPCVLIFAYDDISEAQGWIHQVVLTQLPWPQGHFLIRIEVWIFVPREFLIVYSSCFSFHVRLVGLCILNDIQCMLCISLGDCVTPCGLCKWDFLMSHAYLAGHIFQILDKLLVMHKKVQSKNFRSYNVHINWLVISTIFFHIFSPSSVEDVTQLNKSEASMWVKISSSWVCLVLYTWTLVAPALFPDRDFN